jgi:hypothetical protein
LDGPLPKLCPAVVLSHQDGCRSAVALLLKAALIQVSDYRLLGASGFIIQLYVIKFVSYLQQVGGFSLGIPVSSTNKTDCHDITEILLKMVLSTIKPNQTNHFLQFHNYIATNTLPRLNRVVNSGQL